MLKKSVSVYKLSFRYFFTIATLVCSVFLTGCATVVIPTRQVTDWPLWRDVAVETKDYERMWRTTLDVISEKYSVEVMDKSGGYMKTEWKSLNDKDMYGNPVQNSYRFTAKLFPTESRVRFGVEIKDVLTGTLVSAVAADDRILFQGMAEELQARLAVAQPHS